MSKRENEVPRGTDPRAKLRAAAAAYRQQRSEKDADPSLIDRLARAGSDFVNLNRQRAGGVVASAAGTLGAITRANPIARVAEAVTHPVMERLGVRPGPGVADAAAVAERGGDQLADVVAGGQPVTTGEKIARGVGYFGTELATFMAPGTAAGKLGLIPRIAQGGVKGWAARTGVGAATTGPLTGSKALRGPEYSGTGAIAELLDNDTLREVAAHPAGRVVGDLALDVIGSGVVEAGVSGFRALRGARTPVGAGGESVPDTRRALPPGRYEMPGEPLVEPLPTNLRDPVVDAEVIDPLAHRLLGPGPRIHEAGPIREPGYPRRHSDGSLGVNPEPVGAAPPVLDAVLEPDLSVRLLGPRAGGPTITPAPPGSVLDPNRVDRIASGAVNQVHRLARTKTPPPVNAQALAEEDAAHRLAGPEAGRLAAEERAPRTVIPADEAARLTAAGVDPREAVDEAARLGGDLEAPRLSPKGAALLARLREAQTKQDAWAAGADLLALSPKERPHVARIVEQRVEELPDVRDLLPARPEPPARPSEPTTTAAQVAGGRSVLTTPEAAPVQDLRLVPPADDPGVIPTPGRVPAEEALQATDAPAADSYRSAWERFDAARTAYRAREIGDEEFLTARAEYDRALAEADQADAAPAAAARPQVEELPDAPPVEVERPRYTPSSRIPGAEGREGAVLFADNLTLPVRYRVVEAESLVPSHDPISFQRHPRYPDGVQGRRYHTDAGARAIVEQATQGFRPSRALDATDLVNEGPPLITPDGIAVAGNQRTMLQQRLPQFNPGKAQEYREELARRAAQFGIDPEALAGMRAPVLVREIADDGLDLSSPEVLRELNTRSDVEIGKGKDALSDAETRARQMKGAERSLAHLSETIGEDQTLAAYLGTADGRQFVGLLQEDGVIATREASEFVDSSGVTLAGRQKIQNALLAAAVVDADTVLRAPDAALAKLEHAVPAVIAADRVDGFRISVALREALNTLAEMRSKGAATVQDLLQLDAQESLFGDVVERNPLVLHLAEFLRTGSKGKVKEAFRGFSTDARDAGRGFASDLFGGRPKTFREAFAERFPADLGEAGAWNPAHVLADPLLGGVAGMIPGSVAGANLDDEDPRRGMFLGALAGFTAGAAGAPLLAGAVRSGAGVEGAARTLADESGAWRIAGQGGVAFRGVVDRVRQDFDRAVVGETKATLGDLARARGTLAQRLGMVFSRGTTWMESLGESGKKLAADVRAVDQRAAERLGRNASDIRDILADVAKEQREIIARVVNLRPLPGGNKVPRSLHTKAQQLREVLDRDMHEFSALGGTRLVNGEYMPVRGSGKAFPQVPNKAGLKVLEAAHRQGLAHPRVAAIAEQMVRRGQAIDVEDALSRILRYREERLRGVNRYLERTRLELPDDLVEWDPAKVLPLTLERNARTVEGVRQWGLGFEKAHELIGRAGAESDPAYGRAIGDFFRHHFGRYGGVPRVDAKVAAALSNYQTTARLGLSVLSTLRQIGQRITNTSTQPLSAQLQALRDYPPFLHRWMEGARQLEREIERTGAVRYGTALGNVEHEGSIPAKIAAGSLKLSGFAGAEKGNQVHSAIVARYALERDIDALGQLGQAEGLRAALLALREGAVPLPWARSATRNAREAIERRLGRAGLSDDRIREILTSGGRATPEEIATAMHRLVSDTQFPLTLATERIWWGTHPWVRLLAKFKHFAFEQTGLIYRDVFQEAQRGNVAPLVKFTAATFLMGELYNIARDTLTGREESFAVAGARGSLEKEPAQEIAFRILGNIADGGGVGVLADLVYGLDNFALGPMGTTWANLKASAGDALARPEQAGRAAWEFVRRESSAVRQLTPAARRIEELFGRDNRRYFDYHQTRNAVFRFNDREEAPSVGERAAQMVGKVIEGRTEFPQNERSLSYRYAADAITAGDVDGAAEYLAALLRDAEDREERDAIVAGMEASMRSNAPLGPLNEEEERAFLLSLPKERRGPIRRLNREWQRDYEQAIRRAQSLARQSRGR